MTPTGSRGSVFFLARGVEIGAGSGSDDLRSRAMLTVTGKPRTIRGEDRKFFSVATVGQ